MPNLPNILCVLHARFYLDGLKHSLEIHSFRFTWPCLIIEVLATQVKFLQPSCTFTFHVTNIFGYFPRIMAWFKLVKPQFPNKTTLHVHLHSFQIIHRVRQCTICLLTNYHDTNNCSKYLPWLLLCDICTKN